MSDSISEEEKSRRLAILQDRQREIQAAKNEHFVGDEYEVLVSGKSRRENQWTGYTTSHRMINFASQERELLGTYVQVRVTERHQTVWWESTSPSSGEASMEVEMKSAA